MFCVGMELQSCAECVLFPGKLPPCSKGKHLQLLCDGEEVDSTSFHGVMNFARQGYDVKCQMRPCSSIDKGPVMVEIQNANKVPVESFFDSLGLEKHKVSCKSGWVTNYCKTSSEMGRFYFHLEREQARVRCRKSVSLEFAIAVISYYFMLP